MQANRLIEQYKKSNWKSFMLKKFVTLVRVNIYVANGLSEMH